ncbi:MAG: sugar phosphate nucleotidyltransferase [Anaerolineae bacterium]
MSNHGTDHYTSTLTFAVIMAGGKGSRLWPLSRPDRPKQFLELLEDGQSLLQSTWRRTLDCVPPERILIVGDAAHRDLYFSQLPDLLPSNLLLEPVGRNTGACLALSAALLEQRSPGCVFLCIPADHAIDNPEEWVRALGIAAIHAHKSGRLVAVVEPAASPEPRFGYLLQGELLDTIESQAVYSADRFVEKPDPYTLQSLFQTGRCWRNMGTFAWRADVFLQEVTAYQTSISLKAREFTSLIANASTEQPVHITDELYADIPDISVDHGILTHTKRLSLVPSLIKRIDVGDFSAFAALWTPDDRGNVAKGDYVHLDSANNIVYAADVRVATIGLSDFVIIVENGTVLICPRERTQDIKTLYRQLQS